MVWKGLRRPKHIATIAVCDPIFHLLFLLLGRDPCRDRILRSCLQKGPATTPANYVQDAKAMVDENPFQNIVKTESRLSQGVFNSCESHNVLTILSSLAWDARNNWRDSFRTKLLLGTVLNATIAAVCNGGLSNLVDPAEWPNISLLSQRFWRASLRSSYEKKANTEFTKFSLVRTPEILLNPNFRD